MKTQTIKDFKQKKGKDANYTFKYEHGEKGYITEVIVYNQLQKITIATNAPLTLLQLTRINNTLKEMYKKFKAGKIAKRVIDVSKYNVKILSC